MKRREILKALTLVPLTGSISAAVSPFESTAAVPAKRDLIKELGIRTFINASGYYTSLSGSLMHDEVLETINLAANEFCTLDEVQDKVGERIATLLHAEAATVTSGAFSALMLGMSGVLTGRDSK